MSPSPEPIRISREDLFSPAVQEYIDIQESLRRDLGAVDPQPLVTRVAYSSWFYLMIASGLGALIAWAVLEPYFDDNAVDDGPVRYLLFPTVAGFIGLFLGAAEGIMCRNVPRTVASGLTGLTVGFIGGCVALIPAGLVFAVMLELVAEVWDDPQPDEMPTGFALVLLMMGRAAAWALASLPAGLGQGIALGEQKVMVNGLLGAVLGGLLGGLLFDPISLVFLTADGQASVSRAVGFTCIGGMVGLLVALVEAWTKTAWLLMQRGPLAGKQFVIHRDTTVLGSSPKADVYLFNDENIEPRHALIHNRGGRFEIEDLGTADGTYVNGLPVRREALQPGDRISLGKTVLEFAVKETG